MVRLIPSLLALSAAMLIAAPAIAADYGASWGDDASDGGLRTGYPTEPADWAGLGDPNDPLKFEFGMRYWYSMGAMSATSDGSTVTASDTTHVGELHMRIEDHSTNSFAKAIAGYSIATSGTYSNPQGSGSIGGGHIGYVGADFGWDALGDHNGSGVGLLVGYQYWQEALNTGRNNFTTLETGDTVTYDQSTAQTFLPGDSANNELDINALRLGVSGKANLGDIFDFTGELVGVPYAKVNGSMGVDDPSFSTLQYGGPAQTPYGAHNGNISDIRSSPTTVDGWGYGAMAEAWVGMHPTKNLTFRVGGRAWYLQGSADETYTRAHITDPQDQDTDGTYETAPIVTSNGFISQNNPFSLFRYGLLAEMTYAF